MVILPATIGGLAFTALMAHWGARGLLLGGADGFPHAEGWDLPTMTVSGPITLWGPCCRP
ncbi:hypothetical protein ACGFMM_25145 [Streptomyces sp. NPDC048604]|uniref:hypothetical protein n=1 Tax=Streptomyces sp. NPDC048604 TaxID=3365578 RepID=UPI0037135CA1